MVGEVEDPSIDAHVGPAVDFTLLLELEETEEEEELAGGPAAIETAVLLSGGVLMEEA